MSLAETITRKMGGSWHGSYGTYPGKGHSKRDRSVSIKDAPNKAEGVVLHCHAGDDWKVEMERLRRERLIDPFEPQNPSDMTFGPRVSGNDSAAAESGGQWKETGVYSYDDGEGTIEYRTRRLEREGSKKRFTAERLEDGKWIPKLGDIPRRLYRLTELRQAKSDPAPIVYFVEGERKADKLASWGFLTTAIAFGANGWQDSYADDLARFTVVILPDNDAPGHAFAEKVRKGIEDKGGTAHVLDLPGLCAKEDIVDWQGTADDLRLLTGKLIDGALLPLPTLDLADLATRGAEAQRFQIERIAPAGEVTLFTGPGSSGKSLLGQQLATASAAALGKCLALDIEPAPAIYLTCEDKPGQLEWRQEHICAALGTPMASLAGKLHLISLRGGLDNEIATFAADGTIELAASYHRLVKMIRATGARLVFLDNVAHLFVGNENDRGDVTRFVNVLNKLASETGAAILLIGHPNKGGDSYSGSTAWLNAVRSHISLDYLRNSDGSIVHEDKRALFLGKANYARKGEALQFNWHNWAFVLDDDLPADRAQDMAEAIRVNGENIAFMKCLAAATGRKRAVSHNPGTNFYATVFAKMPEGRNVGKAAFERAFERLLSLGEIELDAKLWQRENRAWKYGIRAVENCTDPLAPTPAPERTDLSVNAARTDPPITNVISGAAHGTAAPIQEEVCAACSGVGCNWCR